MRRESEGDKVNLLETELPGAMERLRATADEFARLVDEAEAAHAAGDLGGLMKTMRLLEIIFDPVPSRDEPYSLRREIGAPAFIAAQQAAWDQMIADRERAAQQLERQRQREARERTEAELAEAERIRALLDRHAAEIERRQAAQAAAARG
jgi:hypothetical protein